MAEIKLRRKGEVVTVDGVNVPEMITPPGGLEGVDLTNYSVIYATFGRGGREKAEKLHAKAPGIIVVYKYEWRNGWGEGVLLPDRFNPARVRFYKTAAQEEKELKEKEKQSAKELCELVHRDLKGVRVRVGYGGGSVLIMADQESFSDWEVRATSLEEAKAGVEKMRPLWKEWNARALEAYLRHSGRPNPGNGNIQVFPSPTLQREKIGVCFDFNSRKWVVFEKQDGAWVETGVSVGSVSSY